MNKCKNCGILTNNPKFCSKSCAAIVNNKKHPKRKRKKYYCLKCNVEVSYRRKYCVEHSPSRRDWSKITWEELRAIYAKEPKKQARWRVRQLSRMRYLKSDRPKYCEKCGYDSHFEVCHIKPIHMFSSNATIEELIDLSNLVALCPNCHWEMDNGFWSPLYGW